MPQQLRQLAGVMAEVMAEPTARTAPLQPSGTSRKGCWQTTTWHKDKVAHTRRVAFYPPIKPRQRIIDASKMGQNRCAPTPAANPLIHVIVGASVALTCLLCA